MDNQHGNLPYNLEQVIEPMAYTIGALLGDGSIHHYVSKNKEGKLYENHTVCISNMDKECVERVCGEINIFCDKKIGRAHV